MAKGINAAALREALAESPTTTGEPYPPTSTASPSSSGPTSPVVASRWRARLQAATEHLSDQARSRRLYGEWTPQWVRADVGDSSIPTGFPLKHLNRVSLHIGGEPIEWPSPKKANALWSAVEAGGIACLIGERGAGKTLMATQLCAVKEIDAAYFEAVGLAEWCRGWSMEGSKTLIHNLRQLRNCPLLVLDDVHDMAFTEFQGRTMIGLLNQRYNDERPTILISNDAGQKELAARLGSTLIDRVKERGAVIVFDWPSFRGGGK